MDREKSRLVTIGWVMFTISGLFFLVQGIQLRDWMTVAGAVAWLIGVACFLID